MRVSRWECFIRGFASLGGFILLFAKQQHAPGQKSHQERRGREEKRHCILHTVCTLDGEDYCTSKFISILLSKMTAAHARRIVRVWSYQRLAIS